MNLLDPVALRQMSILLMVDDEINITSNGIDMTLDIEWLQ